LIEDVPNKKSKEKPMKNRILVALLPTLSLCACGSNNDDLIANVTNDYPTNIRVNVEVGEDVCIKEADDSNYSLYFAHLENGAYKFYENTPGNGNTWQEFVPVYTINENPNRVDAMRAFSGRASSMFSELFNIEIVNGHKTNGTSEINGVNTNIYGVNDMGYWLADNPKMFMLIAPVGEIDENNAHWRIEVKSFVNITSFTSLPEF
jgi:hypothetical protein